MCTEPSAPNGQEMKWAETDKDGLRTREKKELGSETRGVQGQRERTKSDWILREPFGSPSSERIHQGERERESRCGHFSGREKR
ncbi:hypothetical protein TNCV_4141091 [Trichonephila clavipes]|nr:hypothetical protein TNCV_4141091 [Trichonephila clavipes]